MTTKSPEIIEYIDSLREDIDRHDGSLPTAVGMVVGAASSCWSNLSGAGVFESERASALVDLLLSYTGLFGPAASSPDVDVSTPETRHYIGVTDLGRMHITYGPGVPSKFLTPANEPLILENGAQLYPVSAEVAAEWDLDDDDDLPESDGDGAVSSDAARRSPETGDQR